MGLERIIYFVDNYPCLGGAANTLLRQAVLMKHAGKSVCAVVSRYNAEKACEDYFNICSAEDIPVYELSFSVTSQPEGVDIFSVLENYEEVETFIREQTPDIVHSVQLNPTVELACRTLDIPHVMDIYQALPEFFSLGYFDIFPHYHICDSQFYADFWSRYLGTKSYCIRTVAKAEKRRDIGEIDIKNIRFICVGQFCERKNQIEVIKAFHMAVKEGIKGRLSFWGHAQQFYADECARYVTDNGLQDHIEIKGFSNHMDEVYQDSDALICASKSESYPNVISEALAHRIVVISTPVAGVPEIIADGENGYLCGGYKAQDIKEKILSYADDIRTGKIKRILDNVDSTYEKVHSPNAVRRELEGTYNKIISEYDPKSASTFGISDLRDKFLDFIDCFTKNEDQFGDSSFVKNNLWKIYFVISSLQKQAPEQKKCYIWGTGTFGMIYREILNVFAPDFEIAGFIDSFHTGDYLGYRIVKPGEVLSESANAFILIGVLNDSTIISELESHGYRCNVDYFEFQKKPW